MIGTASSKRALITGIGGQDGSYLAEHLLEDGYEVHGIVRRQSVAAHQDSRLQHLHGRVTLHYGDVLDFASLYSVIAAVRPDEVYNLAAQSHVRVSSDVPLFTVQTNGLGVFHVLEACRQLVPHVRFYQASSSEMFGDAVDPDGYQRETTPMLPTSPYGCAKLLGFHAVRHYRKAYGMHACNGILFNHCSPRRGETFVEAKTVRAAVAIKQGRQQALTLGNLDAVRDWGHAQDHTRAMRFIVRYGAPTEFVIATGTCYSVREMVEIVFQALGLDWRDHVRSEDRFLRPQELPRLRGDASKARCTLGWLPERTFVQALYEMIDAEQARVALGSACRV